MRQLTAMCLLIAMGGTAGAHEVAGDPGMLARLGHEVMGFHHLPITVVLVVGIVMLYRIQRNRALRTR